MSNTKYMLGMFTITVIILSASIQSLNARELEKIEVEFLMTYKKKVAAFAAFCVDELESDRLINLLMYTNGIFSPTKMNKQDYTFQEIFPTVASTLLTNVALEKAYTSNQLTKQQFCNGGTMNFMDLLPSNR